MNQNYTVIKKEPIEELDGTGWLLRHKKDRSKSGRDFQSR